MAMIQGIDAGSLINAFRAGKSDRASDEQRRMEMEQAKAKAERDKEFSATLAGAFGNSAGVSGQFAPPQPNPQAPVSPSSGFDSAFNPQAMDRLAAGGEMGPVEAPAAPVAPPMLAQAHQGSRRPDPDILRKLVLVDPERAGKVIEVLKTMDESQLKNLAFKNDFMGAAAKYVAEGKTPQERAQRFQIAAPQLLQAGWTPQELDTVDNDLSDQRLQFYMGTAIDYDKLIDNEAAERAARLNERKYDDGEVVSAQAGGGVYRVKPGGAAEPLIVPNPGDRAAGEAVGGGEAPVRVQSPEEARKLPPGTKFIDTNGVMREVPGGGVSNGTGGFRP